MGETYSDLEQNLMLCNLFKGTNNILARTVFFPFNFFFYKAPDGFSRSYNFSASSFDAAFNGPLDCVASQMLQIK